MFDYSFGAFFRRHTAHGLGQGKTYWVSLWGTYPVLPLALKGVLTSVKHHCILIAEDNEADVLTLRRAFKQLGFTGVLRVVEGGADAIAYLSGDGIFSDRARYPFPDLLLLDLKMPGTNGF